MVNPKTSPIICLTFPLSPIVNSSNLMASPECLRAFSGKPERKSALQNKFRFCCRISETMGFLWLTKLSTFKRLWPTPLIHQYLWSFQIYLSARKVQLSQWVVVVKIRTSWEMRSSHNTSWISGGTAQLCCLSGNVTWRWEVNCFWTGRTEDLTN